MKTIITHNNTEWIKKQIGYVNQFLQIYHPKLILNISFENLQKHPVLKGDRFDPEWLDKNVHIKSLFKDAWISVYVMDRSQFVKAGGSKTLRGYQPFRNIAIGELVILAEEKDWVYFYKGKWTTTSSEKKAKKYKDHMPQFAYTFVHELAHLLSEFYGQEDKLHEYCERGEFTKYFTHYLHD